MLRRPLTTIGWHNRDLSPERFGFTIDAAGRPISIVRASTNYAPFADDIGPSLAASRFAQGSVREGCTLTYIARATAVADAPVEDLYSYSVNPIAGPLPRDGWERISPPGTACLSEPRPAPLVRVFPDFNALPNTPGVRDWSMIGYDIDAGGKPVRVRTLSSTRNVALDRASIIAIQRSRFSGGPRTGCHYPYWRAPAVLPAPDAPRVSAMIPADSRCESVGAWTKGPILSYPDSYRRRSIEGWAIIAFDTAPWGATGNVRILASQPAAEFGERAASMIRAATKPASPQGASGCVQLVRFAMGTPGAPGNVPGQAPPPPY